MKNEKIKSTVVTNQMNEHLVSLTNKYIYDEESFRAFFYFVQEHVEFARKLMNDLAVRYQLSDHYKAAGESLGEHRQTIWRATKNRS